jgi:FK506-binding protein 4/5
MSISIYLNKALCHQRLSDQDEVRHACNEALVMDPKNVKALFRRGQANLSLGEIEKALADFEKVQEIEPENKAALNQITICNQKIKSYKDDEKKRYKNMFSKYVAADGPVSEENDSCNF